MTSQKIFSVAAVLMSLLISGVVQAATFVVDRTDDNALATVCTDADNDCSLRGAITAANTNPGDDTITLPAGIFPITIVSTCENGNADGDFDIQGSGLNGSLIIRGAGAATTIIDGGGVDRVFDLVQ